jgi:alkanesulfonate monooxygenase SsuD/methylene tetrahydromethanopterin reductase-like flavin-dependent oxidoreductase (luciferase family)
VQQPHPPIIIGGAGKKRTPALAAQYASEFNAGFKNIEDTAVLFARVREACEAAGRNPDTLALSTAHCVIVGKDDAEVKRRAAATGRDSENPKGDSIIGTPAQVVDHLGQLAAAGSQRQYVQFLDLADLDQLELIASDVLPQVS